MLRFFKVAFITIIAAFFIYPVTVHAEEPEPDPVQYEYTDTPVYSDIVITELPEVPATLPETTLPPIYIDVSYDLLLYTLSSVSSDNQYTLILPDTFEETCLPLFYQIYDNQINPSLLRDSFIQIILSELGITPDNPLYDVFYDALTVYYNDLTGITDTENFNSVLVSLLSLVGIISLLGFIKWVF